MDGLFLFTSLTCLWCVSVFLLTSNHLPLVLCMDWRQLIWNFDYTMKIGLSISIPFLTTTMLWSMLLTIPTRRKLFKSKSSLYYTARIHTSYPRPYIPRSV
ncbi:hypothetical protein BO83DRAFT_148992 [Aspergillus eucalypticola CBS 122712]|uniref:Uncharacterized protein n=1 Tax=Aspergillus eucalypticola (strain CBS 122712 / IBT 29274) TaxID=1448314 RepID=A0A317UTX9_ASPEC|nr:uncharacterized protein BO83DRAFT_148992 [Aspergillus eucalypticola CBS 122712]PWY63987.1 hypothetical protein BO83DRAFT_148992 [Aspergillus eucalypticola CBS 122712]